MRKVGAVQLSLVSIGLVVGLAACDGDSGPSRIIDPPVVSEDLLTVLGLGTVSERYTAEVWVRGNTAYTTTWGGSPRGGRVGDVVKIWDVSGNEPELVDSLKIPNAVTLGDVQTSDDGSLLVVAVEYEPNGGIALYSLADPRKPQLIKMYTSDLLKFGVHTAEVARVNGRLYAFCAVDPRPGVNARLVIVDITDPQNPVETTVKEIGYPFIHDVFVRDGYLFTAEWYQGVGIWDIGAEGGSIENPKLLKRVFTVDGQVHNIWWFHDPTDAVNGKRYLFVGEEGPSSIGFSSSGDVHVVDITNIAEAKEVAYYSVQAAGAHNFSMDEEQGLLYAAFYNGGVRVIDVRGDLSQCTETQKSSDGRCRLHAIEGRELAHMPLEDTPVYIWGVQFTGNAVYASDMLNGLWKFAPFVR